MPDDFTRWPSNATVVMPAFFTKQKAAQYTLRVVPGGLSLIAVLIQIALPAFLSLYQKEVIKADDIKHPIVLVLQ